MKKITFAAIVSLALLSACSSDNENKISLSSTNLTMHHEETEQLSADENAVWMTENDFVASVSSKGLVKAEHVGKTNIIAMNNSKKGTCEVEVLPKYNVFTAPVTIEGNAKTKSDVKKLEKRTLTDETDIYLAYNGDKAAEIAAIYMLKNQEVESAAIAIDLLSSNKLVEHLVERYQIIGEDKNTFAFINNNEQDYTFAIGLTIETEYLLITYIPRSALSKGDIHAEKQHLLETADRINKILK